MVTLTPGFSVSNSVANVSNVLFSDAAASTFNVPLTVAVEPDDSTGDEPGAEDTGRADADEFEADVVAELDGEVELDEQDDSSTAPATMVPSTAVPERERFTIVLSGFPR